MNPIVDTSQQASDKKWPVVGLNRYLGPEDLESIAILGPNHIKFGASMRDGRSLMSDRKVTNYYEVTIQSMSTGLAEKSSFNIGFASRPYPPFRLPGWEENSVALSTAGHVVVNDPSGVGGPYCAPFTEGTVVGCGFWQSEEDPSCDDFFFTVNGEYMGIGATTDCLRNETFACIGLMGNGTCDINFGQRPFAWHAANTSGSLVHNPPAEYNGFGNDHDAIRNFLGPNYDGAPGYYNAQGFHGSPLPFHVGPDDQGMQPGGVGDVVVDRMEKGSKAVPGKGGVAIAVEGEQKSAAAGPGASRFPVSPSSPQAGGAGVSRSGRRGSLVIMRGGLRNSFVSPPGSPVPLLNSVSNLNVLNTTPSFTSSPAGADGPAVPASPQGQMSSTADIVKHHAARAQQQQQQQQQQQHPQQQQTLPAAGATSTHRGSGAGQGSNNGDVASAATAGAPTGSSTRQRESAEEHQRAAALIQRSLMKLPPGARAQAQQNQQAGIGLGMPMGGRASGGSSGAPTIASLDAMIARNSGGPENIRISGGRLGPAINNNNSVAAARSNQRRGGGAGGGSNNDYSGDDDDDDHNNGGRGGYADAADVELGMFKGPAASGAGASAGGARRVTGPGAGAGAGAAAARAGSYRGRQGDNR